MPVQREKEEGRQLLTEEECGGEVSSMRRYDLFIHKVKRGYFERRVIPYCSNISETTEASELNVVGYNLL